MDKIDIFKLIEEEHIYLAISILLIFIIIFGIPNDFKNAADYAVFISLLVVYFLLKEISKSFFLRDLFLKNTLVKSEINLRKMSIKNKYSDLPDEAREEIRLIDKYSNKFISEYILSFLLILLAAILISLNLLDYIQFKPLTVEAFNVPGIVISFFVLIINLICFVNAKREISEYIVNQNDIYVSNRG
jgi:hypothetical protein